MKITTICNPKSIHNQKQVKVLRYHQNEEVEVFLLEEELLLIIPLNDLTPDQETFKPQSRKEFYEFIQNSTTSRNQIVDTIKYLTNENLLIIQPPSSEAEIINLFMSEERDMLVEEFRKLRDSGSIDFKLVNSIHASSHQPYKNKKNNFKKPRYNYGK